MSNQLINKDVTFIEDKLNTIIQKIIKSEGINATNIIYIATNLMTAISNYDNLAGSDKKKIVINMLKTSINISDCNDTLKILLNTMTDTIIPSSIDLIIDISKGRYEFKHITNNAKKYYDDCCTLC